ncbi:MAG TPA: haloacid dehalogenase type II [Burkholderiales bacterium]|nr:haloacid dehalogenase type II [Burkholderiales bacterium]
MSVQAVIFDAYGTLFDVHSVRARCEALFAGQGANLTQMWRTKQLEYTWLRSLMGRYEDFEVITRAALRYATQALKLDCSNETANALMEGYRHLSPYPEVRPMLSALAGKKLSILSNGAPDMLHALVENNRLEDAFESVLSVHELRVYKPHPAVYQFGVDRLAVSKEEIAFVSSNYWDVAGATAFGLRTYWINRTGSVADELGVHPFRELRSLAALSADLQ